MTDRFISYMVGRGMEPRDLYSEGVSRNSTHMATASAQSGTDSIDISWLAGAAEVYNLSPDLRDYVIMPCVTIVTNLPNVNGDAMTSAELMKFDPNLGNYAYRSFVGKPTYLEHRENTVYQKAKGVILDAYMGVLPRYGRAKLVELLAYDRSKDPVLANRILTRQINTASMGVFFQSYRCSISNRVYGAGELEGKFTQRGSPTRVMEIAGKRRLAFRYLMELVGFETSAVEVPAYTCAVSDVVTDVRAGRIIG